MKKRTFNIVLLLLVFTMVIGTVSCTKEEDEVRKNGYFEEKIQIPKEFNYVNTIRQLDDGSIIMAGNNSVNECIAYESIDGGNSWNKRKVDIPKVDGKISLIGNIAILNQGEFLAQQYISDKDGKSQFNYFIINRDGNVKDLQTDFINEDNALDKKAINRGTDYTGNFIQISNGDILYKAASQEEVVQIDGKTFQEKKRYLADYIINGFSVVGDNIIVKTALGLSRLKLNSEEKVEELNKAEEDIKKILKDNILTDIRLIQSQGDTSVYFECKKGLIKYNLNNDKLELIKGTDYLGIENVGVEALGANNDKEFIAVIGREDTPSLVKYKYKENYIEKPKTELTVYSLKEQQEIRRAILKFNAENEDIALKYEIGITEGSAVTEGDAIKTLNTELMAGKGPDLIVLDYLPVKSYEKQGILLDLTTSVKKYKEELFTGIVDAYKVNKKVYRLPMEIAIPMIFTEKNASKIGDKITDINSLEEAINTFNNKNPKLVTDIAQSPENFISSIYYMFENDWLSKDKKINKENLLKFIDASKNIYTICNSKIRADYEKQARENDEMAKVEHVESNYSANEKKDINLVQPIYAGLLLDGGILSYGPIKYYSMYEPMLMQQINWDQFYYKVFNKGDKNIFMPSLTLGVNNNSKNKKLTLKVFEDIVLKNNGYNGELTPISINKNAFKEIVGVKKGEESELKFDKEQGRYIKRTETQYDLQGVKTEYNFYYPNEKDMERYVGEIDKLNVAPELNIELLKEVCNEFTRVINGDITSEEAVDEVEKNLELYLQE